MIGFSLGNLIFCQKFDLSMRIGFSIKHWFNLGHENARICDVKEGSEDYTCMFTKLNDKIKEDNVCGCNPECNEGKYRVDFL